MRVRSRLAVLGPGRVALVPPAAFAVHQLRYELAYGSAAGAELRDTGHSYLHSVVPWLVALIALALGCFVRRLAQALAGRASPRAAALSFTATWGLCAVALLAIFAAQETLEGWFATGHPSGLQAAFGDGGWWAVPAAAGVGLALAALFRGARRVVAAVARRRGERIVTWAAAPRVTGRPRDAAAPASDPWSGGWSSRGPPGWA